MSVTLAQLQKLMPYSAGRSSAFIDSINQTLQEFEIDTPKRQSAFLAQVALESGELRYTLELADGKAYEGRADLGNTQPGDGPRFKGRGLLQVTGRGMYERLQAALAIDCVARPSLLEIPPGATRSAGYIWAKEKQLNPLADAGHFFEITRRINGGYNGGDQRLGYYLLARSLFGVL